MIDFIEGRLIEKYPTHAVIECNGVGYHLHISLHTFSSMKDDEHCKLFTHLSIREDAHVLYGFSARDERELFRQLISVSGVGPSTAQMILSSLSPPEVNKAIMENNVALLKSIKGIGAKSAQRLIVDLKDKLGKHAPEVEITVEQTSIKEEALAALTQLGFTRIKAERAVDKALKETGEKGAVEHVIKSALKNL